jgi:uncharacterized protein YoxC
MKTATAIILAVVGVALLVCIYVLGTGYRQQKALYAESRQAEEAVRTQFNSALEAIAEVQDSLAAIAPEEAHLMEMSRTSELGAHVSQTQKERMLGTIEDLKTSIRNTRQKVRDLEKQLEGSRGEVAGLKRIVDNLKKSVAEREATIQRLMDRIDSLAVTVVELRADVARGQETIAAQQQVIVDRGKELGTIFYTIGTKKDLIARGILMEEGGVLGIGKSVQLSGAFREGDFTPLDTDQVPQLSITGKEARVLSGQNKASYDLEVGATQAILRIKDAREFRKVRYLVIMVK